MTNVAEFWRHHGSEQRRAARDFRNPVEIQRIRQNARRENALIIECRKSLNHRRLVNCGGEGRESNPFDAYFVTG